MWTSFANLKCWTHHQGLMISSADDKRTANLNERLSSVKLRIETSCNSWSFSFNSKLLNSWLLRFSCWEKLRSHSLQILESRQSGDCKTKKLNGFLTLWPVALDQLLLNWVLTSGRPKPHGLETLRRRDWSVSLKLELQYLNFKLTFSNGSKSVLTLFSEGQQSKQHSDSQFRSP